MLNLSVYPYPNYTPSKAGAGCAAAIIGISLIAWFVQSCQTRFQPRRLSILLLLSNLFIFIELIIRASVREDQHNDRTIFMTMNSLLALGQRMIIISNISFVLEVHHKKSYLSRGIQLVAILCIFTSAILTIPANMYAFEADQIDKSFFFRRISTSIVLVITVLFYPMLYWSKTIKDMTIQAIIVIIISSMLCLIVSIFCLVQSISKSYYDYMNNEEGWFYGFQIIPIILAHVVWSIFHPKRCLKPQSSASDSHDLIFTNEGHNERM